MEGKGLNIIKATFPGKNGMYKMNCSVTLQHDMEGIPVTLYMLYKIIP